MDKNAQAHTRIGRVPRLAVVAGITVAALVAGGCSSDGSIAAKPTTTTIGGSTESTATTSVQESTTTTATTESTLPGEPVEGFVSEGAVLAVIGVAHDDVLNVRDVPDGEGAVVATASPTAADLVATGQARSVPGFWFEVTVDGTTGWASATYLGYLGATDDATAEFLDGASLPVAETMVDLGEIVAAGFVSEEPPSVVVQSVAAEVGDLGEVTYDVIGLGDDSAAGFRLHIFAAPDEGGEGFVLKSIERTTLCARGLSGELCI